ncbi:phage holin family protein [Conexibacter sp. SYSU D00693]|uniref:phage holin family protein n=1 Tax=Conexibacter sp. SYSU D00693 TaxID=2812560 RepID=UPI00196A95AC|nr:phage holin family protein [Conexibacter sp. SYSU D00693]
MSPDQQQPQLAQAIQDVTEKVQLLVREEIELAKTEVELKMKKLARGVVIAVAAGVFVLGALILLLHGFALLAWWAIPFGDTQIWGGYFVVAGILLLLAGLAGFLAAKAFKAGAPPAPELAIQEAKLIRETVTSSEPQTTVGGR